MGLSLLQDRMRGIMIQLQTKFSRQVDEHNVLPEYPRPSLVRTSYLNLNGRWECAFSKTPEIPAFIRFEHSGSVFPGMSAFGRFQTAKARRISLVPPHHPPRKTATG